jgi:hypothetical protein
MKQEPADYMFAAEAATELHVTKRTLYGMVQRSLLIPRHFKGIRGMHFLRSDVQQLQLTLHGEKSPDLQQVKSMALQALAMARRSEQRLTDILGHLGLDIPPMPRDEGFVRGLYTDAKEGFAPTAVTDIEWLKFWSDMFFGMDEVYLELVTLLTGDDEPWKVFFDFSSDVVRELHRRGDDIPESARRLFQAARSHLRHVGYMHCRRMMSAKVANIIFDGRVSAIDELEAVLS